MLSSFPAPRPAFHLVRWSPWQDVAASQLLFQLPTETRTPCLWVSSPHALERESDWLTWSQMSSPGPISCGHGASSHRTKMAPQRTGPTAWVHYSCDAQNGQNVFKAHVTALQTGWRCRACPSASVELSFVSGRLSSSRLPWKHGATPAHHWGLLSLECLPPGLIFVVLPPGS